MSETRPGVRAVAPFPVLRSTRKPAEAGISTVPVFRAGDLISGSLFLLHRAWRTFLCLLLSCAPQSDRDSSDIREPPMHRQRGTHQLSAMGAPNRHALTSSVMVPFTLSNDFGISEEKKFLLQGTLKTSDS